MRDFTCLYCGKPGIDNSHGQNKKFCDKYCGEAYRSAQKRATYVGPGSCSFNEGVVCDDHKCAKCGWNPVVARKRSEALQLPGQAGRCFGAGLW